MEAAHFGNQNEELFEIVVGYDRTSKSFNYERNRENTMMDAVKKK